MTESFVDLLHAGALAPIVALKLLGDIKHPNHTAVASYLLTASVLTLVAVLCTRETRGGPRPLAGGRPALTR